MPADDAYNTREYRSYQGRLLRKRLVPLLLVGVAGVLSVWLAIWLLMD